MRDNRFDPPVTTTQRYDQFGKFQGPTKAERQKARAKRKAAASSRKRNRGN